MRSLMMKRKVKKVFDYSKLRGKIKEVFGTQAKFAKAMGMSTVTLSAKLNGTVQFTAPEMNKACEVLGPMQRHCFNTEWMPIICIGDRKHPWSCRR